MNIEEENERFQLLGAAMMATQRIEFALYGLAAHASGTPAGQKEKRFRDLNPRAFLDGDPSDFKATLGQLVKAFGDQFMISSPELDRFCNDRNTIAHNFWRIYVSKGSARYQESVGFLKDYIVRSLDLMSLVNGLLKSVMLSAAKQYGRTSELSFTENDVADMNRFEAVIRSKLSVPSA